MGASLAMGLACYVLLQNINNLSDLSVLLLCFLFGSAIYLISMTVMPGGKRDVREYYSFGRLVFAGSKNV